MATKKKSFFERLTGGMKMDDDFLNEEPTEERKSPLADLKSTKTLAWETEEDEEEGQLTVDLYDTASDIIVQTLVAGVKPEDLSLTITRDTVIIKGKREASKSIEDDSYYIKELYWGSFSRTISLPQEVEPEEAEAIEKHGMLIIKLPKIDKEKKTNLKVKSI
ncbi:Hsp20/alpha crystallin family protein [Candidatus Nomurabacteria bacterium]|nr:Hsp20/alpha crystallin family protein [Candidatus Nomurabacteria bacterium]